MDSSDTDDLTFISMSRLEEVAKSQEELEHLVAMMNIKQED